MSQPVRRRSRRYQSSIRSRRRPVAQWSKASFVRQPQGVGQALELAADRSDDGREAISDALVGRLHDLDGRARELGEVCAEAVLETLDTALTHVEPCRPRLRGEVADRCHDEDELLAMVGAAARPIHGLDDEDDRAPGVGVGERPDDPGQLVAQDEDMAARASSGSEPPAECRVAAWLPSAVGNGSSVEWRSR